MLSSKYSSRLAVGMTLLAVQLSNAQAQKSSSRLSVDLGGGYALFSPDELNQYIAQSGREEINNGFFFSGGLRVQVSSKLDLNARVDYLSSTSKSDVIVTGESGPEPIAVVQDEYSVRTVPVSIGLGYRIPLGKVDLRAEFSAERHSARVSYQLPAIPEVNSPAFESEAKSSGIGFRFAAGPEWRLSSLFSLSGKIGYRDAKISDFLHSASQPLPLEFALDLSGVFFETGIQIHP